MSGQAQADQVEAQAAQVEQEYRREEKRESKAMDSKLLASKFNVNPRLSAQAFSKAIDDENRSVASGQSSKTLSPALFFESATAKSAAEIGESAGTGPETIKGSTKSGTSDSQPRTLTRLSFPRT